MKNLVIPMCQMADRTSVDEQSDKMFVGFGAEAVSRTTSIVSSLTLNRSVVIGTSAEIQFT